ncbi:hypothetical protein NDN08_003334 [Rhodosorus marinus]|uniref:BHLH domain-containing protein n=1 Tax=Rhodosorus marinus TaxID=101924 RepID=A0AAV8UWT4_9RHOD|nr:hypothetical protein NDN08_003334 [Rhodosorus marinus]
MSSTTPGREESDDFNSRKYPPPPPEKPSLSIRKRDSERRRREEIHTSFKKLEDVLCRSRGEDVIHGRKWDREKIVHGATEHIKEQEERLASLRSELSKIAAQVDDIRSEKVELRADKLYLKEELEKLQEENQRLRHDNKILIQSMNKEQHWPSPDMTDFQAPEPATMYEVAPPQEPVSHPQPGSVVDPTQIPQARPPAVQNNQPLIGMQGNARGTQDQFQQPRHQVEHEESEHYNWDAFDGSNLL